MLPPQAVGAVVHLVDHIAVLGQALADVGRGLGLVFDDQDRMSTLEHG